MDWDLIISQNQAKLLRFVTLMFAMLNGDVMPPEIRSKILMILRPAESAARRLIVVFMRVHKIEALAKVTKTQKTSFDFSTLRLHATSNAPRFRLYDPQKRFDMYAPKNYAKTAPHIRFFDGRPQIFETEPEITETDIDPKRLINRMKALQAALNNLPRQAKRLARCVTWQKSLPAGPRKMPPLRPGFPPGYRKRAVHPVDETLLDCHYFAKEALKGPT